MSRKNSNGILETMAVISESFKKINITEEGILELMDAQLYVHLFECVPDFRQQGKITYRLPDLLMLIFLVIIEKGKCPYEMIEDYIEARAPLYEKYGLLEHGVYPSHDTIRRVLTLLDSEALYENTIQGFYNFLRCLENNVKKQGDYRHIGFDGKEIRGSGRAKDTDNPKRNTAMFNIYDSKLQTCILSVPIDEKENEIPVAQKYLQLLDLKDTVLTADALHCQKDTAAIISDQKGTYILTVKDNQQLLLQEIEARFSNPKSKITSYTEDGRIIDILDLPKAYALTDDWKDLKCFVRMTSHKRKNVCTRYFITSTRDHKLIIAGIENRWAIEDDLHKPKDVDFGEDLVRSTNKNALRNIAIMNNLVLQIVRIYQAISGKEPRKAKIFCQANPIECLNLILGVMSSEEIVNSLIKELQRSRKSN